MVDFQGEGFTCIVAEVHLIGYLYILIQDLMKNTKDRIQIDGVWYVKETNTAPVTITEDDLTKSLSLTYEPFGGKYCWEATRIFSGEDSFYNLIDIKFVDKRTSQPWKEDDWDNNTWMIGVYENDPDALKEAREMMCEEGLKQFQAFIKVLIDKEWL